MNTVETHDTWECALRLSWEEAWMENCTLMITDALSKPLQSKLFFLIQQVVCHELSFCCSGLFLSWWPFQLLEFMTLYKENFLYFSKNNGLLKPVYCIYYYV